MPSSKPSLRANEVSPTRVAIDAARHLPEPQAVAAMLEEGRMSPAMAARTQALGAQLVEGLRSGGPEGGRDSSRGLRANLVQGLLQEFSLSSDEGIALMCLAEALLRIPDNSTRDALIRDKIGAGDWRGHLGKSPSLFVNAAAWGLLITGKLVAPHGEPGLSGTLARLLARGGEPLVRRGVDSAMRMMGAQFVKGETIADALNRSEALEARGFRHSYDMLGETALTAADAQRYFADYESAIHAIGLAAQARGPYEGPGISVKLSALHPRYSYTQQGRVMDELYPRLLSLAMLARRYDVGLNIDAEEAERLDLSLDLLERLCGEPSLAGWAGIGFVVQAYQKRCPFVVRHLISLARRTDHRLMVRLVKGAYWDSEVKHAQVDGHDGYQVYTRKAHTDVAYIACARLLLAAPDAVYPQFATHNAQTLAAIHEWANPRTWAPGQYEFQCLHGMGESLYEQVVRPIDQGGLGRPCRIYAPVGTHETLLAYLVRRLLENGANSSFVNRVADPAVSIDALLQDPVQTIDQAAIEDGAHGLPHPAIALPRDLYGAARINSRGLDLSDAAERDRLLAWAPEAAANAEIEHLLAPPQVGQAMTRARDAVPAWNSAPADDRARVLEVAAEAFESSLDALAGTMVREAGKTWGNAVGEVREAVDFLRYYAHRARLDFADGGGGSGSGGNLALGPVVCISPWNFPLAIFTGQVAAALAAGNTVLAKPAEQAPRIAAYAVRLLWKAGVPRDVLQLLNGPGATVGAQLVAHPNVRGVMFTGSTEVARLLQKSLAGRLCERGRPIPLIAETGGQNVMVVDSSALPEQVVSDVMASAFDSAGQRCSALRVLCVQDDIADGLMTMLRGAMAELTIGDPAEFATDVGPVIDADAHGLIERHVEAMKARGNRVDRLGRTPATGTVIGPAPAGHFVIPTLIEIASIAELAREVFGPVLHVRRYRREQLTELLAEIDAAGYGLTFGLHTRIDEAVERVVSHVRAGNVYVNRNIVGAVVGVQPFGGERLSGTGPKAGGPLYLRRLVAGGARRTFDAGDMAVAEVSPAAGNCARVALAALAEWACAASVHRTSLQRVSAACERFARESLAGRAWLLRGPTGERNRYALRAREAVLCVAEPDADEDRLVQLAAVLATGGRAIWPRQAAALHARLPQPLRACVAIVDDWRSTDVDVDLALVHGGEGLVREVCHAMARRSGAIVSVEAYAAGDDGIVLERLLVERVQTVNTAAAGGNASLMTMTMT